MMNFSLSARFKVNLLEQRYSPLTRQYLEDFKNERNLYMNPFLFKEKTPINRKPKRPRKLLTESESELAASLKINYNGTESSTTTEDETNEKNTGNNDESFRDILNTGFNRGYNQISDDSLNNTESQLNESFVERVRELSLTSEKFKGSETNKREMSYMDTESPIEQTGPNFHGFYSPKQIRKGKVIGKETPDFGMNKVGKRSLSKISQKLVLNKNNAKRNLLSGGYQSSEKAEHKKSCRRPFKLGKRKNEDIVKTDEEEFMLIQKKIRLISIGKLVPRFNQLSS